MNWTHVLSSYPYESALPWGVVHYLALAGTALFEKSESAYKQDVDIGEPQQHTLDIVY